MIEGFRLISKKGEGTFSEVLKCQNVKSKEFFACKKMKQHYTSWDQVNNLREIQAMKRLNPHDHILQMYDIIFCEKTGILCLILELMDLNLYEVIKGRKNVLPESQVKLYAWQMLNGLNHIHNNGIFHRDVKPENILIRDKVLKIADFGSCKSVYSRQPYTEYISTRWYRAPECLLTDGYYSFPMDLWSVGCVIFEILSLRPLFPGANEIDQIAKIHDVIGTPDISVLRTFKKSRSISFNFPPKKGTGIERYLPNVTPETISFIQKLCEYDPQRRITSQHALQHSYFKDFRPNNESITINSQQPIKKPRKTSIKHVAIENKENEQQQIDTPMIIGSNSSDKSKSPHNSLLTPSLVNNNHSNSGILSDRSLVPVKHIGGVVNDKLPSNKPVNFKQLQMRNNALELNNKKKSSRQVLPENNVNNKTWLSISNSNQNFLPKISNHYQTKNYPPPYLSPYKFTKLYSKDKNANIQNHPIPRRYQMKPAFR